MLFFKIIRRLEAAEARLQALEAKRNGPSSPDPEEEAEKAPAYRVYTDSFY